MRVILLAASALLFVGAATATATNLRFTSTVSGSCTVIVVRDGTMRANATNKVISSRFAGETSGLVRVTNTVFARVSAHMSQITWNHPAADTSYSDVRAYIAGTAINAGGTNRSEVQGNAGFNLSHGGGTTDVTVNLEAKKNGNNVFEAETYSGTVVVTCA